MSITTANREFSKSIIISNLFWKYSERIGAQVVSFVVTVVLARLLSPAEYGLIAMVTVFIIIANQFVTVGIGSALIQKKDADNLDFSSIFFLNAGLSVILYGIIFASAPIVANFYGYEVLTPVMRVMGLIVIVAAMQTVQQAYVARNMLFKKFFFSTFGGTLASGVAGIVMAFMGFGIWALVAQYTLDMTVNAIVLWFTVKWRPQRQFSIKRVRSLFSFGWKLLCAGLLTTIQGQLNQLIIGKMYTSSDLAYYNKGLQFPALIMDNINSSISAVMFPVVSQAQDDLERLRTLTRQTIRVSSYFVFPMMIGLAVVAEPLIKILLTEKWSFCVPYLRIGCFAYAVTIMQFAIQNAIQALGRTDVFLKMDIIRKGLYFPLLIIVMKHGVMAIALLSILTGSFSVVMVAIVSKHMFAYSYREHINDNLPILIASSVMGLAVYMLKFIGLSDIVTLCMQVPFGIVTYIMLSMLFKFEGFELALEYIKDFRRGKNYV